METVAPEPYKKQYKSKCVTTHWKIDLVQQQCSNVHCLVLLSEKTLLLHTQLHTSYTSALHTHRYDHVCYIRVKHWA